MGGRKWYHAFIFSVDSSKVKLEGRVHSLDIVGQWYLMAHWVIGMELKYISGALYIYVWWLYHKLNFVLQRIYGLYC